MHKNKNLYKNIKSLILFLIISLSLISVSFAETGLPIISNVGFEPNSNGFTSGTVTVSADVIDTTDSEEEPSGVASVSFEITDNDENSKSCEGVNIEDDIYSCGIDTLDPLPDGEYSLVVTAIDSEDNEVANDETTLTIDNTHPVTIKTYGEPNEQAQIKVPSCEGDVFVNGHFIATNTEITLSADDEDGSGVEGIFYAIEVPVGCEESEIVEWVGLEDKSLYEDAETCELAVDNQSTEELETQECVSTFWQLDEEFLGEEEEFPLTYTEPFVIPNESLHKICFFSVDNAGNQEDVRCQVVLVDDNAPVINSADVNHEIIDLEYYSGGVYGNNYFDDPKCAIISVNATDAHIDEVQVSVHEALMGMFYPQVTEMPSFNENAWEKYMEDEMHHMPVAELNEETELYEYEFCPGTHIYHLYNNEYEYLVGEETQSDSVINSNDARKLVSEKLVLGTFELLLDVNDTTGKEAQSSVDVTVVDLTVPLELGWNLRSTPLDLEGDKFWSNDKTDAVLSFNSEAQTWELVTDNKMVPLDALYMHATDRNQYGIIFERDKTSPPSRQLNKGWNLAGLALQLNDYLSSPCYDTWGDHDSNHYGYHYDYGYYLWHSGYHYGSYEVCTNKLTNLYDDNNYACVGEDALNPLVFDPNGNTALEVVISPAQYLSYCNNDEDNCWNFNQNSWVWLPQIGNSEEDGNIVNDCDEYVQNFGGYWLFMQNEDLMPGFTETPLQLNYD